MTTDSALKAWKTMLGPVWKAKRTGKRSQEALQQWADEESFLGGHECLTTLDIASVR